LAVKLFLSHSSADKAEAQRLRQRLEDCGVGVWEDVLELRAGDRLAGIGRGPSTPTSKHAAHGPTALRIDPGSFGTRRRCSKAL
jgi:hypothetical protein